VPLVTINLLLLLLLHLVLKYNTNVHFGLYNWVIYVYVCVFFISFMRPQPMVLGSVTPKSAAEGNPNKNEIAQELFIGMKYINVLLIGNRGCFLRINN